MQEEILDQSLLEGEEQKPPIRLYPSVMERGAAFVVDAWLLGMVLLFVFFIGVHWDLSTDFLFPFLLLIPLYKWSMEGKFGGTIGKALLQMRIVYWQDKSPINYWTAFKRNSPLFIFFLLLMIMLFIEARVPMTYDFEFPKLSFYSKIGQGLWLVFLIVGGGYGLAQLLLLGTTPPRSFMDKWASTIVVNILEEEKEV